MEYSFTAPEPRGFAKQTNSVSFRAHTLTADSLPSSFRSSNFMTWSLPENPKVRNLKAKFFWQSPTKIKYASRPLIDFEIRKGQGQLRLKKVKLTSLLKTCKSKSMNQEQTSAHINPLSKSVWIVPAAWGAFVCRLICQHFTCKSKQFWTLG